MNKIELCELQALPLDVKVEKSKRRIIEWIETFGIDKVYASFSGGVGSSVLYYILQDITYEQGYKKIPCLFINTRNEFPELIHHVYALKAQNNAKFKKIMKDKTYNCPKNRNDCIEIRKPKYFMRDVIANEGYLVVSKKTSRVISDLRKFKLRDDAYAKKMCSSMLNPKNRFSVPKRWQFLISSPVKISYKCCRYIKHSVINAYEKETGRIYPFTGEQASESYLREAVYLKHGCNGFDMKKPKSMPLGFWTQSDLLEYLKINNLPYPKCYGDIVLVDGHYTTTGEKRTGCYSCLAGLSFNEKENRFQRLEYEHPKQYKVMFSPFEKGGLGYGEVLDYMHIPYHKKEILDIDELIDLINYNRG